ncbi:MAG: DUF2306 domain-containing protein [Pseudomonadota bacterium]
MRPTSQLIKRAGTIWFVIALTGQVSFVLFILLYYGTRTASGDISAWNEKPLITGYVEGDAAGNAGFGFHVLAAAVITMAGLMQLIPGLRQRAPGIHRWTGRLFITLAFAMALGGLALVWGRGTRLADVSAYATSGNALLIMITACGALYYAISRKIEIHRRWATHLFLQVNGVWFMRVGIMAWAIPTQGAGMNNTLSGPADLAISYGCYLIPPLVLELYYLGQRSQSAVVRRGVLVVMGMAILITALGIAGAVALMWWPYLW